MASDSKEQRYGIGAVARMTGLNPHTIRVWERRYAAVVAERTDTGRRRYSPADVERLGMLAALTTQGVAISQVATLSVADLRAQLVSLDGLGVPVTDAPLRVAVLGDFLPAQLRQMSAARAAVIQLVASAGDQHALIADLKLDMADVIAVEVAVLDPDALTGVQELLRVTGVSRGVLVFSFARTADARLAQQAGIGILRAPASDEQLETALRTAAGPPGRRSSPAAPATKGYAPAREVSPRRFSQQQLALLAQTTTSIDCECPQHLAQLVRDLNAFEIYSANCTDRNADDAALHAYLHATSAQAREMMEEALHRVATAEGLLSS